MNLLLDQKIKFWYSDILFTSCAGGLGFDFEPMVEFLKRPFQKLHVHVRFIIRKYCLLTPHRPLSSVE